MSNFDPYSLSSGLPLADVDATVTAVEFRFDTSYAADACVAAVTFQPDEGDEQEQLYSCGRGWEPIDRGENAAHVSGKPNRFNEQTNYGRFLKACFQLENFMDEVREEGVMPWEGAFLLGKRFHLGTVEYETRNPSKKDSEPQTRTAIVPTEYLGMGEDDAPAKAPAKKAAAKKTAAKGPSAIEKKQIALIEELEAEEGGEEIVAALRELATESEDFDAFMEGAMEIDGVAESDAAQKVAMSSKAGSIWAQAQDG